MTSAASPSRKCRGVSSRPAGPAAISRSRIAMYLSSPKRRRYSTRRATALSFRSVAIMIWARRQRVTLSPPLNSVAARAVASASSIRPSRARRVASWLRIGMLFGERRCPSHKTASARSCRPRSLNTSPRKRDSAAFAGSATGRSSQGCRGVASRGSLISRRNHRVGSNAVNKRDDLPEVAVVPASGEIERAAETRLTRRGM